MENLQQQEHCHQDSVQRQLILEAADAGGCCTPPQLTCSCRRRPHEKSGRAEKIRSQTSCRKATAQSPLLLSQPQLTSSQPPPPQPQPPPPSQPQSLIYLVYLVCLIYLVCPHPRHPHAPTSTELHPQNHAHTCTHTHSHSLYSHELCSHKPFSYEGCPQPGMRLTAKTLHIL